MSAKEIRDKIRKDLEKEYPGAKVKLVTKLQTPLPQKHVSKLESVQTSLGLEKRVRAKLKKPEYMHLASIKTVKKTEDGKELPVYNVLTFDAKGKKVRSLSSK